MAAILVLKPSQNYYQANLPSHKSFVLNLMKLSTIFQELEYLYDFQTIGYVLWIIHKQCHNYMISTYLTLK